MKQQKQKTFFVGTGFIDKPVKTENPVDTQDQPQIIRISFFSSEKKGYYCELTEKTEYFRHLYFLFIFLFSFLKTSFVDSTTCAFGAEHTRYKNTTFSKEKFLGKFKGFQLLKIAVFDFFSTFIFSFIFLFSFLKTSFVDSITIYKNTKFSKENFLGKFKVFQLLKIVVFDFFSTIIFLDLSFCFLS